MRKLAAASQLSMPWKNGGGTTTEIARSPEGTSLDAFDWRISRARVAAAGPFSRFPGVDRSIVLLEGAAMTLAIDGRGDVRLDRGAAPFAFPADVDVAATLEAGGVEDFNVMTRRGRYRHLLSRVRLDAPTTLATLGERALLFVADGETAATLGAATERLEARDALLLDGGARLALTPARRVEILVVDLWPLFTPPASAPS